MDKAYTRVNFENLPSHQTPLSATTLNILDKGIDDLDDRIIALDGSKVDKYKDIPNPIDLNTLTETGFYSIPNLCTNIPSGANGGGQATVQVISTHVSSTNAYIVQIFYNQLQVDNVQQVYFRIGYGTIETPTFLSWQIMAVSSDLKRIAQGIGNMWDLGSYANTSLLYSLGFPTHMYPAAQQGSNAYALDVLSGTVYKNTMMGESSYTWTPYDTLTLKVDEKVDIATYNVTGAKNLLPMTLERFKKNNTSGTWSGNAYTYNGVTFTVNIDNNGNVTGIDLSGTASTTIYLEAVGLIHLDTNNYILTNYIDNNIFCYLAKNGSSITPSSASGVSFTATYSDDIHILIRIISGTNCNGKTLYPMIRLATDTDSTFQPYAKTNLELTDDVRDIDYRLDGNACKNVLDIEKLLNVPSVTITKNNNAYTINNFALLRDAYVSSPFYFSDEDKDVSLSVTLTSSSMSTLKPTIILVNKSGSTVESQIVSQTNTQVILKGKASGIKFDYNSASGGTQLTFDNFQIERGSLVTPYEPYYPSNKELASTRPELKSGTFTASLNSKGYGKFSPTLNGVIPVYYSSIDGNVYSFIEYLNKDIGVSAISADSHSYITSTSISGTLYYYEL